MTHSYLLSLWRQAVHKTRGDYCVSCGAPNANCHHVIYVRRRLLAYDERNGLPLCAECHRKAHAIPGWEKRFLTADDVEYLDERAMIDLKDYYLKEGLTREEWHGKISKRLRSIIAGGDYD